MSPFAFLLGPHPTAAPAPQPILSPESSARDPEVRGDSALQGLGSTPTQNIPACGGQGVSEGHLPVLTLSVGASAKSTEFLARNLCTDPAD